LADTLLLGAGGAVKLRISGGSLNNVGVGVDSVKTCELPTWFTSEKPTLWTMWTIDFCIAKKFIVSIV
jgi:hypothetical protein